MASGKRIGQFPHWSIDGCPAILSGDSRTLFSGGQDHTVKLWDVPSGKLLLSFIFFSDGEWATWTPEGYYTASPGGDKYIGWQINRGDKEALYYSCDQFKKVF